VPSQVSHLHQSVEVPRNAIDISNVTSHKLELFLMYLAQSNNTFYEDADWFIDTKLNTPPSEPRLKSTEGTCSPCDKASLPKRNTLVNIRSIVNRKQLKDNPSS
jgi:hypothetical protein